ncbi:aglE [Acrasis kona]|uniref:AglE n=1 Tax=Acrasis kona TaxID=1008807 RepID=A0AAW2ZQM8_9EUKA
MSSPNTQVSNNEHVVQYRSREAQKIFLGYTLSKSKCQSFYDESKVMLKSGNKQQGVVYKRIGDACTISLLESGTCLPNPEEFGFLLDNTSFVDGALVTQTENQDKVASIITRALECYQKEERTFNNDLRSLDTLTRKQQKLYMDNIFDPLSHSYSFQTLYNKKNKQVTIPNKKDISKREFQEKKNEVKSMCEADIEQYERCLEQHQDFDKCQLERIGSNLCTTTAYCSDAFKQCIKSINNSKALTGECLDLVGSCAREVTLLKEETEKQIN